MTTNVPLLFAAVLAAGVGVAHSWLGEQYLLARLLRRDDLPKLFGADTFTRRTLRFAWHLTTIAWWGFAAVMVALSGSLPGVPVGRAVLLAISLTFFASAALTCVASRGRHLAWPVFLAIAILTALAIG